MVIVWESFSPAFRAGIQQRSKQHPIRTYGELAAHDLLFTGIGAAVTAGFLATAIGSVGLHIFTSGVIQDVMAGKDQAFFTHTQQFVTDQVTKTLANDRIAQSALVLSIPAVLGTAEHAVGAVVRGAQFSVLGGNYLYKKARAAR